MKHFYLIVSAFLFITPLVLAAPASPDLTVTLRRLENVLLRLRSKQLAVVDMSRGQSDVTKPDSPTSLAETASGDNVLINKNTTPMKITAKVENVECTALKCSAPCNKNVSYFDQKGNLIESKIVGQVKKNCGNKDYYFFKKQVVYQDAWATCCSIGKKIVTFESKGKIDCAIQIVKALDPPTSIIWTGGLNEECNKKFVWCLKTPEIISKTFWSKMEPNNMNGNEYAVSFKLNVGFNDEPYTTKQGFLCE